MQKNDATLTAFRDITEYLISENLISRHNGDAIDRWIVCRVDLEAKENRKLNRYLGLHKVNKQKK